ncbi:hypothetical protein [Bradyrhizobium sp. 6(2017)]|uniref:hypothetical protein n=1 Tax=Bradyrhizobium sp. 6(2017) TaxID=1197460 RepID=UPI0013E1DF89|nr:hypothetical protein [Bradyrhizobium sp. 6(2017)]QIG94421.1 hypothetical protein G6P99_19365 [Bradyrhizobium sp. 6(2017)]
MKEFSLLGFIAELGAIERDLHALPPMVIEQACKVVQKKAKGMIGKGHDIWPDLTPSTIHDKEAHGFPVPKPLLRTGELRDSIEYTVSGHEGAVGTDDPRGPWFEFGTLKMPPRPFLVPAAQASEDKIHRMAGAAYVSVLAGHGRHARDARELLHALHMVGHAIEEKIDDLFDDDAE